MIKVTILVANFLFASADSIWYLEYLVILICKMPSATSSWDYLESMKALSFRSKLYFMSFLVVNLSTFLNFHPSLSLQVYLYGSTISCMSLFSVETLHQIALVLGCSSRTLSNLDKHIYNFSYFFLLHIKL